MAAGSPGLQMWGVNGHSSHAVLSWVLQARSGPEGQLHKQKTQMVSYAGGLALTFRHKRASSFGYMVFSPARRLQLNFRLLWEWEK